SDAGSATLAAAVRYSPMANLLISVAIEESRGDPAAVGSAGEQGAWQVKASSWGLVPKDIRGQACQAERILRGLLARTNGNKKTALARYNGGTTPPGKSYRYAERILKRAGHLQIAVNYLPPDYIILREALLDFSVHSRML
ncbi:MAG: lytic transglycosylase domain-containing protein, partial [Geobacteraceae bacterium]|nr:lytic transglycosylase domain-containing protein [Geobacteraceae bacterium]